MLIIAAGVSIWQSVIANRQRHRADAEAATAKAVNQFLQDDLLSQANPEAQGGADTKPDPDVKARTLLNRAAAQVEKRFSQQPLVESAIQHTIGKAFYGLGLYPEAERHLRRAYELSAAHRGADDPQTLDMLMMVSEADVNQDKNAAAIAAAKSVFEGKTRKLGSDDPQTVVAMQNLGSLYFQNNQFTEAESLLKKALEFQTRRIGYDNIDTLNTSDTLAALYIRQSRNAEARALLARGLESYKRLYGPTHPFTEREMFGLAKVTYGEGDYTEAQKLYEQVQAAYRRSYGERHVNTLYVDGRLGMNYIEEGQAARAIPLLQKTVAAFRAVEGPGASDTLWAEMALARAYDSQGDLAHAGQTWQLALQGYRHLGSYEQINTANVSELLGQNLTKQRKYTQAEALLRQALAIREKGDLDDWELFRAQAFLGASLAGQKRYAEAEPLLLKGYQGMLARKSRIAAPYRYQLDSARESIIQFYQASGQPEKAAEWNKK